MSMQIQLALSTLLVPLVLSFVAQRLSALNKQVLPLAVFTTWLASYLWITGTPSIPPKEAIEWSVYLGAGFVLASFIIKSNFGQALLHFFLGLAGITLIVWPVISHAPELQLYAELLFFAVAGAIISYRLNTISPASPALNLAIFNGGLTIVAGLGGSLLIGQLAGALASTIGAFALFELYKKIEITQFNKSTTLLVALLSLLLLVVARIYAEITLVSVVLLTLSLLIGLSCKWKYTSLISLIAVVTSIAWLLLTADKSSYY